MSYTPPPPGGGYGPPPGYGGQPPGYGPPQPGYGGYGGQVEHPQGTTILVMGILSLVICGLLGPVAWNMGNKALREIDGQPGRFSNRGQVQAGRICGMIASCFLILAVILVFLAVILGGLSSSSN